jgi:hypothetical protein
MNAKNMELAEQAGLTPMWVCVSESNGNQMIKPINEKIIEHFAELVRVAEREACAKLCESMGVHPELNVYGGGPDWYKRQKECAAAIRARGEK